MSIKDYSRRLFCNIKWGGLRCNPSCLLYGSTDNGLFNAGHAYQVPLFCLLPSGYLIVCFVHVSVCASVQLEMHRPENTNKITDVRVLHIMLYTLAIKLSIFHLITPLRF